ncbi:hypothetical protein [Flavobacterium adhaerens]|uniref:hypothetical protein n=1 Tax=Flavobacterium adhaerens TaxID=3149043 RepID=UPI0032B52BEE
MEEGFHKVKGNKIIIYKRLDEHEIEQIKKHKNSTEIGLWHTKNKNLDFLQILNKLKAVDFYGIHTENFEAMATIETLERVFLNNIKNHNQLSFLGSLKQIQELDLLYLSKLEKFPDLSNCQNLKSIRIMNCKKLTNIENLAFVPNLEEINIIETPQTPEDLEFLIQLPNIKYCSAQFGKNKLNSQFEKLLMKYGKTHYRPI